MISASPDPVSRGDTLVIGLDDETRPYATVSVTITDGTTTEAVQIELGADGSGTTTWQVPAGWGGFGLLTEPESADVTVVVE